MQIMRISLLLLALSGLSACGGGFMSMGSSGASGGSASYGASGGSNVTSPSTTQAGASDSSQWYWDRNWGAGAP